MSAAHLLKSLFSFCTLDVPARRLSVSHFQAIFGLWETLYWILLGHVKHVCWEFPAEFDSRSVGSLTRWCPPITFVYVMRREHKAVSRKKHDLKEVDGQDSRNEEKTKWRRESYSAKKSQHVAELHGRIGGIENLFLVYLLSLCKLKSTFTYIVGTALDWVLSRYFNNHCLALYEYSINLLNTKE